MKIVDARTARSVVGQAGRYHAHMRGTLASVLGLLLLQGTLPAQMPSKELAQVAAAYAAKVTASAIFVSGRSLESVLEQELAPTRPIEKLIGPLLRFDVDAEAKKVTVRLGIAKATAQYVAGLGCSLAEARDDTLDLDAEAHEGSPVLPICEPEAFDPEAVRRALDAAFAEPHADRRMHTRAVVVLHRGKLVAERYADGFDADMPLAGWSMTKTLTHALLGMRVADGKLDIDAPANVPQWRAPGDARGKILVRHLLQMDSGLEWNEDYDDPNSDVLRMLFASRDHAATFTSKQPAAAPGERYQYASGSTNTLCLRAAAHVPRPRIDYWRYPQRLFGQLGMRTAVLETDPSGTFVGSSYGFASARDWARLGQLYLQDGVYGGKRILPEGWVAAAREPVPSSNGRYGHHVWLNRDPDGDGPKQRRWPELPEDLFHMDGHEGQYVVIAPSAELVIVRLGCTKNGGFRIQSLVQDLLDARR